MHKRQMLTGNFSRFSDLASSHKQLASTGLVVLIVVLAVFVPVAIYKSLAAMFAKFEPEGGTSNSASLITKVTNDTSASGSGYVKFNTPSPTTPPTPPPSPPAASRSKYTWPYSRFSIWNMPIGSGAVYQHANMKIPTKSGPISVDNVFLSLSASAPIKRINGDGAQVHVLSSLQSNGAKNGCTGLLAVADKNRIHQGQWLTLTPGGNPSWPYDYSIVKQSNPLGDPVGQLVALNGPGMWGCHGGSALSSVGASIKKGELSSSQPIRHALMYEPYCYLYCSPSSVNGGKPFRWPAYRADGYALDRSSVNSVGEPRYYNGTNPNLTMGSLLALKPDFNVAALGSAHARKIAQALKDYGAYIGDDVARDRSQWAVEYGAEFGDGGSFQQDMFTIITSMHVITNNGPTAVGGGGKPRVCYAPPFNDGTADAIATNPNGSVAQPAGC